jgi:uncharacterized protein DUF5684
VSGLFLFFVLSVTFVIVAIAGMWRTFEKGGQAGWKSIIPIYNHIIMLELIGRPTWWIVLLFIPLVDFVIWLIMCLDIAKSYGRGTGTGLGLFFLTPFFFIMLGFGEAEYKGPVAATA